MMSLPPMMSSSSSDLVMLSSPSSSSSSSSSSDEDTRIPQIIPLVVASLVITPSLFKEPCYTSPYTGYDWIHELMHPDTHPDRIRRSLGVRLHVFNKLLYVLRHSGVTDSQYVTLEEQLRIFLHACVTGLTSPHLCERFQRSGDTIST